MFQHHEPEGFADPRLDRGTRELYAFFAETLQLPIAWPMTSPRSGVMTGGGGFGNVNVEAIQFPKQTDPRPRLLGLPSNPRHSTKPDRVEQARAYLRRTAPIVCDGIRRVRRTLWTNATLRQSSDSDSPADATIHIFLSEYSPTYVYVGGAVDVKEVIATGQSRVVHSVRLALASPGLTVTPDGKTIVIQGVAVVTQDLMGIENFR